RVMCRAHRASRFHRSAYVHTTIRRCRRATVTHAHHRKRLIVHFVPSQQPIMQCLNLSTLSSHDMLAECVDRLRLSFVEAVMCHVQGHLMMIAHALHKAHFGASSPSWAWTIR